MNGLTIFSHSLRQVIGNLGMAIKVSGWLAVLYAIGGGLALWAMPEWLAAAIDGNEEAMLAAPDFNGGSVGLAALLLVAAMVFLLWSISLVAIAWHRYILLEEVPHGLIPYRKEFRIGRYFWYGLGISLLATLVVTVISGILGMIFGPFFMSSLGGMDQTPGAGGAGVFFLIGLAIGLVVAVLYLRMALILPAVALQENLTLGQAWEQSSGYTGAIFVLALVLASINAVVPLLLNLALGELAILNLVLNGLFQWFYFMLNISVLSTLYGYIVQKREVY